VTQWVPLYESSEAVVKSEFATFFEAFPSGTVWGNDRNGEGYDVVLLGQQEPSRIDVDAIQARLDRPDHQDVVQSLQDVKMGSAVRLLATYAGQAPDLTSWLEDAEINHDRNLRLQYLAGMHLNASNERMIYEKILARRRLPEELFSGSDVHLSQLRWALDRHQTDP
jgi:spermidine synthase